MADKIFLNARYAFRSDTLNNWQNANPILEKGEPAVVTDGTHGEWLKIGDGVTPFNSLEWKKGPKGEQGLQGIKGDKGEKGEPGVDGKDGKDAVIDQTYSPTSENAQSGKAVAEAILGIDRSEVWEKITDVTLEEDAVVSITKDEEGNAIRLKKFKVLVELPAVTSATQLYMKLNNVLATQTQVSSATAVKPSYSIEGEYTFDWQFLTCLNNTSYTGNGNVTSTPYGHRYSGGKISFPCTSIGIALDYAYTKVLPAGARIRIWGVKA